MVHEKGFFDRLFDFLNYTFLVFLGLLFLYPVVHVLAASFSNPLQLMQHQGPILFPLGFSLDGYKVILSNPNIISGYLNTIINTTAGTLINIFFTSLGAYAISRNDFMAKKFFTTMFVITMYIGGGMIPGYLLVKALGMVDTRWSLLIPGCISTYNMIVLKTCFAQLPRSVEDSAKIDGANDYIILFRILFPMAKATIMVLVLFCAVGHWNSWFAPMLYIRKKTLYPLALIIREILISNSTGGGTMETVFDKAAMEGLNYLDELMKYSTIVITTAPILCVYPFVQKYFVKGVMLGSIKE